MTRDDILDKLASNGCFSGGDAAAMANASEPIAKVVRAAVRAALDGLETQGFITFKDPDEWPMFTKWDLGSKDKDSATYRGLSIE